MFAHSDLYLVNSQIKCQWFILIYDICRMKQILLFGAGKSATVLIDYMLANAGKENWKLIVVDANLQLALDKIKNSSFGTAVSFDIMDDAQEL